MFSLVAFLAIAAADTDAIATSQALASHKAKASCAECEAATVTQLRVRRGRVVEYTEVAPVRKTVLMESGACANGACSSYGGGACGGGGGAMRGRFVFRRR